MLDEFKKSAKFIAAKNVGAQVVKVIFNFDPETGHIKITYYTEGEPSDGDRDNCELTCSEMIAAFPEIRTAETNCQAFVSDERVTEKDLVVFSRNWPLPPRP